MSKLLASFAVEEILCKHVIKQLHNDNVMKICNTNVILSNLYFARYVKKRIWVCVCVCVYNPVLIIR